MSITINYRREGGIHQLATLGHYSSTLHLIARIVFVMFYVRGLVNKTLTDRGGVLRAQGLRSIGK